MAKSLKDILAGTDASKIVKMDLSDWEKSEDGRKFAAKHTIQKHADRVGNGDDVYNGSKVKPAKYPKQKDSVYEAASCESGCKCDSCKKRNKKLHEVITKKTSAGEMISDFEKSDNPKFAGKSKEERKRMALGAYYGMHPEKSKKTNEEVEELDELSKKTLGSYIKNATSSATSASYNAGTVKSTWPHGEKYLRKEKKRKEGISRAVDKLTSEELAQPLLGEGGKKVKKK